MASSTSSSLDKSVQQIVGGSHLVLEERVAASVDVRNTSAWEVVCGELPKPLSNHRQFAMLQSFLHLRSWFGRGWFECDVLFQTQEEQLQFKGEDAFRTVNSTRW